MGWEMRERGRSDSVGLYGFDCFFNSIARTAYLWKQQAQDPLQRKKLLVTPFTRQELSQSQHETSNYMEG